MTLRLVTDAPHPAPPAVSPYHAVIVEDDVPGSTRITIRHRERGVLGQGTLRDEELTDGLVRGLALYFLGSRDAVLYRSAQEATG